jgi:hypothetical protein
VDLGSNSFHLVAAKIREGELLVVNRMRDVVRLAGLDEQPPTRADYNLGLLRARARTSSQPALFARTLSSGINAIMKRNLLTDYLPQTEADLQGRAQGDPRCADRPLETQIGIEGC